MKITVPLSVGMYTEGVSGSELVTNALRLESLGYRGFWLPEVTGREPFSTAGFLLAKTTTLHVNTGIANTYIRDANAAVQGANTLAEFANGRFTLGLGASHPALVEPRGHQWLPPLKKMRSYLEDVRKAVVMAPPAAKPPPVIIAAHGPKLLKLASQQTDGVIMYMQPATAIQQARNVLGDDKQLNAVALCVLAQDKEKARDIARKALAFYINLPAYHQAWTNLGYDESDWNKGGSDRLIDAICGCGNTDDIANYLLSLEKAGASEIILSPLHPEEEYDGLSPASLRWDWDVLESFAPNREV